MIVSTRSLLALGPSSSRMSLCSHCQTWDRAISAVAASSIRLKMATAPLPASQEARYCRPTLMSLRSPASVIVPGVSLTDSRSDALTLTSSRSRSSWLGLVPRTRVPRARAAPVPQPVQLVRLGPQHAVEHLTADRHQVRVRHPGPVEAVP